MGIKQQILINVLMEPTLEDTLPTHKGNPRVPTAAEEKLSCSIGRLDLCITDLVYFIGPGLAAQVAGFGAAFMNILIKLSLSSGAYALDFLAVGWEIVRAIANIAFLFLLIYIAIVIVLEAENANTMRMLATFILMALLVNFSFLYPGGNRCGKHYGHHVLQRHRRNSQRKSKPLNIF